METERLVIDALRPSDREDYFHNISHDRKVLETFICRYAESLEDFDFSSYLQNEELFAIRLKETDRLIGIILYFDEKDGVCEIGYGLGSKHWGRGYATEAAGRFIDWLFDEKGMRSVCASFFVGNNSSRRVMEKCGMRFERYSEKELSYLGAERDLIYYAVRKEPGVLLLNGPSSAGKSSIARELLKQLESGGVPASVVSLDDHMRLSPGEQIWEDDVFEVMPELCREVERTLREGRTVIVDHVITSGRIYAAVAAAAAGHRMRKVRVTCDTAILRQREAARGDRFPGSAEESLRYLYPKDGYDLTVDSGKTDPAASARLIRDALL